MITTELIDEHREDIENSIREAIRQSIVTYDREGNVFVFMNKEGEIFYDYTEDNLTTPNNKDNANFIEICNIQYENVIDWFKEGDETIPSSDEEKVNIFINENHFIIEDYIIDILLELYQKVEYLNQ